VLHTFPNAGYAGCATLTHRYITTLTDLHTEFNQLFSNFDKIEGEVELVSSPLSFDSEKVAH